MRLAGKRAVVTAAGAGIGRATAQAFAAEGAEVIATDIDIGALEGLAGDGIRTRRLDATDAEVIAAAKAAHVDHFVRTLPDGYDTILDEETLRAVVPIKKGDTYSGAIVTYAEETITRLLGIFSNRSP